MQSNPPNRREFVKAGARCLILGGLATLAGAQELKRRRLIGDPDCVRLNPCADCFAMQGCTLPKADAFREASRGDPETRRASANRSREL